MFAYSTVLVRTLIAHCFVLMRCNEVQQHNPNECSKHEFKNKDILMENTVPDLSELLNPIDGKSNEDLTDILALWKSIKDENNVAVQEMPFTIIIPKVNIKTIEKERLKEFLFEHLIPGKALSVFNEDDVFGNCNKHEICLKKLKHVNESTWTVNGLKVIRTATLTSGSAIIYIDGVLSDRKMLFSKRNIQETNRYNEPQRLEMKNATKEEITNPRNRNNKQNVLMTFLTGMKSGTKVFQHFLTKSNLSQQLSDSLYTILIPSDNAFQRWHPIDWGFYPFSVQEFTEDILRNHFVQMKSPLRMADFASMDREQSFKTIGGEMVVFRKNPPTVNNVSILANFNLPNGNEVFLISEVLFMSEAVVSRLHQMHNDKETPPLLAFPWFGAQFLSHSFLALERDNRFTQIVRYMNTADIAQYISGANYTFFVPTDDAFEKFGLANLPENVLASEKGIQLLLNHFVKGRLYDRDLKNDEVFETIGGGALRINRKHAGERFGFYSEIGWDNRHKFIEIIGNVTVNRANIIETEIFVYNLGTMFYIDEVLYSEILTDAIKADNNRNRQQKNYNYKYSTLPDVEAVPHEFTEQGGTEDDVLFQDDEIVTPRALPVRYMAYPYP